MQEQQKTSYLAGGSTYIEDLYELYLQNPQSVSKEWRDYFVSIAAKSDVSHSEIRQYFQTITQQHAHGQPSAPTDSVHERKQMRVTQLIEAYRSHGHYHAQLDPLGLAPKRLMPDLDLTFHQLSTADLNLSFNTDGLLPQSTATLKKILDTLQSVYSGSIGFEYEQISDIEQIEWLQKKIESVGGHPNCDASTKKRILESLIAADGLERYLGSKYVGQTRFSLEGGDAMMPLIDELIRRAANQKVKEIVVGMGHRGRLNVLVNILGKAPSDLYLGFEGKHNGEKGSGDVKYHMGFAADLQTPDGPIHVALAFNPSHLEIIDPVVEGSVAARQQRGGDTELSQVIPLLIHGDAAFSGQGVVMETFAMSQTRGFGVGGTLHIVVNNQIGFTISNPRDARSTWYCTDVAKMVEAPILHVNADDPEAVVFVAQLALDFRMKFKKDVVIDLVCYRRLGHNEGDEPAATQPVMYQTIKQHPSIRKLFADRLIAEGIIDQATIDALSDAYRNKLDLGEPLVPILKDKTHDRFVADWKPYYAHTWDEPVKTGVAKQLLKKLAERLETLPVDMTLQPQVAKMMDERRKITAGESPVNWGYAETLAYATLLNEGYPIRMSGQDCGRGTFAHRHAVLHDFKNDNIYIPLQHIAEKQAVFTTVDSFLSEEAVLAFEYGYSSASPNTLVIWEAQYGDFANGAQVVVDQFISSGEQKWGRLSGLTQFLPHGYEGAGPEHSSARLERYLQLCAEHNMQVCVPSTPAQIFHLLRRQMVRLFRKPLIVLTPKSMLRHKLAVSTIDDLADGEFQLVIPEIDAEVKAANVDRVILCSGKVYYDLLEQRRANKKNNVAILRIEQLYPFPEAKVKEQLALYKKAKSIVWCQEEPQNQGAWYATVHHIQACLMTDQTLAYVGRQASAAPATGIKAIHTEQQKALVEEALGL